MGRLKEYFEEISNTSDTYCEPPWYARGIKGKGQKSEKEHPTDNRSRGPIIELKKEDFNIESLEKILYGKNAKAVTRRHLAEKKMEDSQSSGMVSDVNIRMDKVKYLSSPEQQTSPVPVPVENTFMGRVRNVVYLVTGKRFTSNPPVPTVNEKSKNESTVVKKDCFSCKVVGLGTTVVCIGIVVTSAFQAKKLYPNNVMKRELHVASCTLIGAVFSCIGIMTVADSSISEYKEVQGVSNMVKKDREIFRRFINNSIELFTGKKE